MTQVRKVVINQCFGGFGLSDEAELMFAVAKGMDPRDVNVWEIQRDDTALVQVVEQMGVGANGNHSRLKVVEIPADVQWEIAEYDGVEHIAEIHRKWW